MPRPDDLDDRLRDVITSVLDDRSRIPEEEHREHHDWVRSQIDRQRARADFWAALAQKSLPAIIVTLLGAGASWVIHLLRTHINWS